MSEEAAARVGDPFAHTMALNGALTGLLIGAAVGVLIVSTGGLGAIAVGAAIGITGAAGLGGSYIGESIPGPTTGMLAIGSPNVFVNGRPLCMVSLALGPCAKEGGAPMPVATGSGSVFVNGLQAARVSERMQCSAVIQSGSPDVFIGGPSVTVLPLTPEVPAWLTTTMKAMAIGGLVIATGGIAAEYGAAAALDSLVGGMVGSTVLSHAARWGAKALGFGETGQRVAEVGGGFLGGWLGGGGARGEGEGEGEPVPEDDPETPPATTDPPVQKLNYKPTSGVTLEGTPGKTTTVLGSYKMDTSHIVDEMGNVKSTDFGPKPGQLNVLNVPDDLANNSPDFWNEYNKPWLQDAVDRGDPILMATSPDATDAAGDSVLTRMNDGTGELEPSGFGREVQFLQDNGYSYQNGMMVK
jgi:uncharacterized Zn-binding protein involved in type VI secretion